MSRPVPSGKDMYPVPSRRGNFYFLSRPLVQEGNVCTAVVSSRPAVASRRKQQKMGKVPSRPIEEPMKYTGSRTEKNKSCPVYETTKKISVPVPSWIYIYAVPSRRGNLYLP